MQRSLMGQILSGMGNLDLQDIEEILQEQRRSGRRFGQIALAWGLCSAEDIWKAWRRQLQQTSMPWVNLQELGIDARAAARLPRALAVRYDVMPVRMSESLVLAADRETVSRAMDELPGQCEDALTFVLAARREIHEAIDRYYRDIG